MRLSVLTTDMEMEPVAGYTVANWEKGYGDFHLVPDLATLRVLSWQESTACVLCDVYSSTSHQLEPHAPRSILQGQLHKATAEGFICKAASELEYYVFNTDYRTAQVSDFQGMEPVGWYLEDYHLFQGSRTEYFHKSLRNHFTLSGIPVESTKGEWGKGQHEINVRYAEIKEMADRHVLLKQGMKEIADNMGISVSFMAKYHEAQAGSSCHIHLSLWKDGKNAFVGEGNWGPVKASRIFGYFLAGWIRFAPEVMVFYAPTINSYKRYQDSSWAPTRLAWSQDNRTAGFRVVGAGESLRIECRIPGADCNPYLAFSAALASGLAGIAQQLEPPPCFVGDVYAAQNLPRVPGSLREATALFAQSPFVLEAFGEAVQAHYTTFFSRSKQLLTRW